MDKYRLSVQIDEARKLFIGRVVGPMPSAAVTEAFMQAYRGMDRPWLYNRLIDYRKFSGTLDYADTEDFVRQWHALRDGATDEAKVAFVTDDALELARANAYDNLTPNDRVRSFTTMDQALEWFDEL